MSQNKGNYFVMADGSVIEDTRDWYALLANTEKKPWDFLGDDVIYMGCYWQTEDGLKACLTDRQHNNMEIIGATIESLVGTMNALTGR